MQIRRNAVTGKHEKADGFAGPTDLADDFLLPDRIAGQKRCDINDRDSLDGTRSARSLISNDLSVDYSFYPIILHGLSDK